MRRDAWESCSPGFLSSVVWTVPIGRGADGCGEGLPEERLQAGRPGPGRGAVRRGAGRHVVHSPRLVSCLQQSVPLCVSRSLTQLQHLGARQHKPTCCCAASSLCASLQSDLRRRLRAQVKCSFQPMFRDRPHRTATICIAPALQAVGGRAAGGPAGGRQPRRPHARGLPGALGGADGAAAAQVTTAVASWVLQCPCLSQTVSRADLQSCSLFTSRSVCQL